MKLILLSGRRRVGKDTCGDIIKHHYGEDNINIIALADCLKDILASTFNISVEQLDKMKNNREKIFGLETRDILINFSEKMLEMFGINLWCELSEKKLMLDKINVITDMRFTREYDYFSKYNPYIIKIKRDNGDIFNREDEVDTLPYTYEINNNGTIDEYKKYIIKILDNIEV